MWKLIYPWMIVASLAMVMAKIAGSERVYEPSLYAAPSGQPDAYQTDAHAASERTWPSNRPEPTPMFGSNDRSRWATIYALVENGTYVVGRRVEDPDWEKGYRDEGVIFQPQFGSVDKVLNPDTQEFYSSKPPLYSTILAGEYWLIKQLTGWSLDENRWPVVMVILFTVNVIPLAIFLILLARLLDRFTDNLWAKLFILATACFGTYLTTFSMTLNNHTPAACLVMIAAYTVLSRPDPGFGRVLLAGFMASLAACFDLTAAAFFAGLGLWVLLRHARLALLAYLPVALIPIAGFFYTNYLAIGQLTPVYEKFGSEWYEYEGSHWKQPEGEQKRGIDFIDEPKTVYAFHFLLGHHGILSLTPVWLVALVGMIGFALRRDGEGPPAWVGWGTLLLSVVVFSFYVWRTNNYGGWSSGPRWLFWLIPLWLMCMVPAAEWMSRFRASRFLAYILLGFSVFSAAYPMWNPWRHPWIYQMFEYYNWVRY